MTIPFVGGDELAQSFLLEDSDGEILDISGMAITGIIRWRRLARLSLDVDVGIEIETEVPVRAVDQAPHGIIRLTEDQTILFPFGAIADLKVTVIDAGVTMTTYAETLRRMDGDQVFVPPSLVVLRLVNGRRASEVEVGDHFLAVDGQWLTISGEPLSIA